MEPFILFGAVSPRLSCSPGEYLLLTHTRFYIAFRVFGSETAEHESPHGRLEVAFTYTGINSDRPK